VKCVLQPEVLVGVFVGVTSWRRPDDRPEDLGTWPGPFISFAKAVLLYCGLGGPLVGPWPFRYEVDEFETGEPSPVGPVELVACGISWSAFPVQAEIEEHGQMFSFPTV